MPKKLTLHAPFFAVMAAGVALMIVASPATMSAKTSLTAGTVRNVCGQPVGVHNSVSKTLDPSKTTFTLNEKSMYYYQDRYVGDHIDPRAFYELRVLQHGDGTFEVFRGRRVPSCQNNPAKG